MTLMGEICIGIAGDNLLIRPPCPDKRGKGVAKRSWQNESAWS